MVAHQAVVIHLEGQSGKDRTTAKHSIARNIKIFLAKWVDSGRLEKAAHIKLREGTGLRITYI